MEGKHTATPLRIYSQGNITHEVFDANDEPFAMIKAPKEKASFIVRAVNAHDDLVAAVHHALTHEDGPAVRDVLRAALSKAGGLPDIAGAA